MNVGQLLRPEELSDVEIIGILASLNVSVSFNNPRSYLLDVYKRVALPLPQRQTRVANDTPKLTSLPETETSVKLDLFKSLKREQIPITHIVDNTKKMKLHNSWLCDLSPKTTHEHNIQENYLVESNQKSKRKLRSVSRKCKLKAKHYSEGILTDFCFF